MTAHVLLTRRMLLKDMGRAGLAVMVLGTTACAQDPTSNATPTEEPTTPASTAAAATSTPAASPTLPPYTASIAPSGTPSFRRNAWPAASSGTTSLRSTQFGITARRSAGTPRASA